MGVLLWREGGEWRMCGKKGVLCVPYLSTQSFGCDDNVSSRPAFLINIVVNCHNVYEKRVLFFFDEFSKTSQLAVTYGSEIEMVEVLWEEKFRHPGVKEPFDFIFVVSDISLVHVVKV